MDQAHRDTDKTIAQLERRISRLYRDAQKDVQGKLDEFTRKFHEKDRFYQKELQAGKITREQYQAWLRGQVFQGRQWQAKLNQITATLNQTNVVAQGIINGQVAGVFSNNANWISYQLEHGAGLDFGFDLYDPGAVARLLRDQPNLLPPKMIDIPKDLRWSKAKISQQIAQGIIQGERLDQIAQRLRNVTDMNENMSKTHARTAMTGAQNAGRQESLDRAAGMGIKTRKEWVATLDERTRTTHRMLDGQQVDVDKPFAVDALKIRYPGDPHAHPSMVYNCRCTMIGVLVDYPARDAQRYDNIDGKKIADMTYQEWHDAKAAGKPIPEKPVNKPVETVEKPKRVSQLNGIRAALGDEFVDHMQEMLEKVDNQNFRDVYYKYGDQLGVVDNKMKKGAHYDPWAKINEPGKVGGIRFNEAKDITGDTCHLPYQTAFHEFGHNIDRLGGGGNRWLSMEYKNGALGKAIKADYKAQIDQRLKAKEQKLLERARATVDSYSGLELRTALQDLGSVKGKDFSEVIHGLRRGEITRDEVMKKYRADLEKYEYGSIKYLLPSRETLAREFIEEIRKEGKSVYDMGSVSDILEGCTGISYPLGVGHGANYHKTTGYTPLEFFAETCDGYIANRESYEQLKRFFPTAVKIVEEMMEVLAK